MAEGAVPPEGPTERADVNLENEEECAKTDFTPSAGLTTDGKVAARSGLCVRKATSRRMSTSNPHPGL